MKIYVASNRFNDTADQLVKQLASIKLQPSKTTPVIVVDERYNLGGALVEDADVTNTVFHLDDFLRERSSIDPGALLVDADQFGGLVSDWVVFEFGQNDYQKCLDFVRKLARYNYMSPTLRDKSVVFSVPSMYLDFFARIVNESFNNLPAGTFSVAQSGQVGMLMLSTKIERVFVSLPLLSAPLSRLKRLVMFIYKRFVRAI